MSQRDKDSLTEAKYWLCASMECDYRTEAIEQELYDKARQASWALQIICPTGAMHIFLQFEKTTAGYDNIGSIHPKELCSTLIGRLAILEQQNLERDFDAVYGGVRQAFTDKIVRLQNPILLIEHGMQICTAPLGILMFVMGLDMLFMAGEMETFLARMGGFLGLETLIFPPDSFLGRQPNTRVRDVLHDLYDFRNIIAHGQEIPLHPYRQPTVLISTRGEQINLDPYNWTELILESALFMLTTALRMIFVNGLCELVADDNRWHAQMKLYEHRYKNAGGLTAVKLRGR